MRVGKDRQSWQELECYLFEEMLICVKEKKASSNESQHYEGADQASKAKGKCTLKGSILIKKHLKDVEYVQRKYRAKSCFFERHANIYRIRHLDAQPLRGGIAAIPLDVLRPQPAQYLATGPCGP
jgi:hypothetical protein